MKQPRIDRFAPFQVPATVLWAHLGSNFWPLSKWLPNCFYLLRFSHISNYLSIVKTFRQMKLYSSCRFIIPMRLNQTRNEDVWMRYKIYFIENVQTRWINSAIWEFLKVQKSELSSYSRGYCKSSLCLVQHLCTQLLVVVRTNLLRRFAGRLFQPSSGQHVEVNYREIRLRWSVDHFCF